MLNAGLFEFIVVDDWKAQMWAQVLPEDQGARGPRAARRRRIRAGRSARTARSCAAEIDDFYANCRQEAGRRRRPGWRSTTSASSRSANNDRRRASTKRFERRWSLFEKYGAQVRLRSADAGRAGLPGVAAATRSAKSHVGAIGVMQIMPATGEELRVGDIHQVEPNIHGGAKYMDQLMTQYFPDAKFSEANRPLFAFASYNAGPGNISKMRKEAAKRGLDPGQVVQQRRAGRRREDRHGDHHLRAQHLQVLRLVLVAGEERRSAARRHARRQEAPESSGTGHRAAGHNPRMIGRLTGVIAEKSPPLVLIDVGGVGYELDVPMSTFYNLPGAGRAGHAADPLRGARGRAAAVRLSQPRRSAPRSASW